MIDEGKFNWNERPVKDSGGIDDTLSPRVGIVNNRRGINQSPIRVFIALLNGTAGAWRRVALVLRFDTGNQAAKEREGEREREREEGIPKVEEEKGQRNESVGFREDAFVSTRENIYRGWCENVRSRKLCRPVSGRSLDVSS